MPNQKISGFATITSIPGGPIALSDVNGVAGYCDDPLAPGNPVNVSFSGSEIITATEQGLDSVLGIDDTAINKDIVFSDGGFNQMTINKDGISRNNSGNFTWNGTGRQAIINTVSSATDAIQILTNNGAGTNASILIHSRSPGTGSLKLKTETDLQIDLPTAPAGSGDILASKDAFGNVEWLPKGHGGMWVDAAPNGIYYTSGGVGINNNNPIASVPLRITGTGASMMQTSVQVYQNLALFPWFSLRDDKRIIYSDGNEGLGKVLTSDATGVATWVTPASGTVTSITTSNSVGASSGVSFAATPNPIVGSGTIALGFSGTIGDILYADTASTLAKLPANDAGKILITNGVGTAPSWAPAGFSYSMIVNQAIPEVGYVAADWNGPGWQYGPTGTLTKYTQTAANPIIRKNHFWGQDNDFDIEVIITLAGVAGATYDWELRVEDPAAVATTVVIGSSATALATPIMNDFDSGAGTWGAGWQQARFNNIDLSTFFTSATEGIVALYTNGNTDTWANVGCNLRCYSNK